MIGSGKMSRRLTWMAPAAALVTMTSFGVVGGPAPVALAQDTATPVADAASPAVVSVTGQGIVTVAPDTATVTVGIDVIREELAEAQSEATRQATEIIAALNDQGIESRDIQTANYSVNVMRDYSENGDPSQTTGYEVMNQVNVTIRDISTLGALLDAVTTAGANSIYGITFYVDDQRPHNAEARKLAVADAMEKAEQLADAAGLSVGRVVSISESTGDFNPMPVYGRGGGMMAEAAPDVPVESGSSQITVNVNMSFELVED